MASNKASNKYQQFNFYKKLEFGFTEIGLVTIKAGLVWGQLNATVDMDINISIMIIVI